MGNGSGCRRRQHGAETIITDTPTGFADLTPDAMVGAVEAALGERLVGFAQPLPSYINRVYEMQTVAGTRVIAKFYRPGRWTVAALQDEHAFVLECAAAEIPAVAPLTLASGSTLGSLEGVWFAVYPKRRGREFEATGDDDWRRLGRLIGRVHAVGAGGPATHRATLRPDVSTAGHVRHLLDRGLVTAPYRRPFEQVTTEIIRTIAPPFRDTPAIRIHGDCHRGNLMDRPGEGLLLIDFDDMAIGPPVQDLWMLLPERADQCQHELELVMEGYRLFQPFTESSLALIEPLRAMRMLHYLAWCGRQADDPGFARHFPDWGTDPFWRREIQDLEEQLEFIRGEA